MIDINKTTLPIKGLNLDVEPDKQQPYTYRFALNVVDDSIDGSRDSVVNEFGNSQCFQKAGFNLIGHVPINDGDVVLFFLNDVGVCEIGIVDDCCTYTTFIQTDCLNFNACKQIKGQFKIRQGCERVITLYDCFNDDKYINLDRLDLYYTTAYENYLIANPGTTPEDYFTATGLYAWDCNKMKLNPDIVEPCIEFSRVVESNGVLPLGSYQFAVEMLDDSFTRIGFSLVSQPIPIVDDVLSPGNLIDGGYNFPAFAPEIGGVNVTSKSIELNISNILEPISYIRLVVVRAITGDGVTKEAFIINNQIPTSNITEYIYSFEGINPEKDLELDLNELVIPKAAYNVSCVQQQINNRLVRANVTEETYNWAKVQQAANTINTEYQTEQLELKDEGLENNKFPSYTFFKKGYMRDEIYAFGIVLKMKNGTFSPAFHIPGREVLRAGDLIADYAAPVEVVGHGNANIHNRNQVPKISDGDLVDEDWDEQLLTVNIANIPGTKTDVYIGDVEHLGFLTPTDDIGFGVGLVPRWMVYNTAIKYSLFPPYLANRGLMGYFECTERYPETKDRDGNFIYPTDKDDPTITAKIRHHRFPDAMLENHTLYTVDQDKFINPIGVVFDTSTFYSLLPQDVLDDVEGHMFVRSKRSDYNKTVLDKGILRNNLLIEETRCNTSANYRNYLCVEYSYGMYAPNTLHSGYSYSYVSPKVLYDNFYNSPGTYLKYEMSSVYRDRSSGTTDSTFNVVNEDHYGNHELFPFVQDYLPFKYRLINSSFYLEPEASIISNLLHPFPGAYEPYDDLYNFLTTIPQLVYSSNYALVNTRFNGFPITDFRDIGYYVAVKRNIEPYNNLSIIDYIPISTCLEQEQSFANALTTQYGGDIFISRSSIDYSTQDTSYIYPDASCEPRPFNTFEDKIVQIITTESEINSSYRHGGTDVGNTYYERILTNPEFYGNEPSSQWTILNDYTTEMPRPSFLEYNKDFSITLNENIFRSIPISFNYCSDCLGKFPNRIVWSPKSFEEEVTDTWKITYANDYVDISANKGDITNMKFDKSQLLVTTEESLLKMIPNPQQIQTDSSSVYIGTGDFLSIEPREFSNKDFGYAGNQGRFNAVSTEYGWTWVDQIEGKIFNYDESLEEISARGMYHWFEQHLPSSFDKWCKQNDIVYTCRDNTSSQYGVGLIATYDPLLKRYILHKSDYLPLQDLEGRVGDSTVINGFYYDIVNDQLQFFVYNGVTYNRLKFSNPTYFENKSWTISYDYNSKSWKGWHSYQPNYMYHDNKYFNTFIDNHTSYLWRHSNRGFQTFYDTKFDSIIEYVTNQSDTQDLDAIHWYSRTELYDSINKINLDVDTVTFNKLMVYTQCQTTGELNLEISNDLDDNLGWSKFNKKIIKSDLNHRVAQLRDISIQQPILTSDWNNIQYRNHFNQINGHQGYIDKVQRVLSLNQDDFDLEELRDMKNKYFITRLWFNNDEDDYKLIFHLINNNQRHSFR